MSSAISIQSHLPSDWATLINEDLIAHRFDQLEKRLNQVYADLGEQIVPAPENIFRALRETCVKDSDLILHLTEWKIYRELDPVKIKKLVNNASIIDGRNALDRESWRAAGWRFHGLGRV